MRQEQDLTRRELLRSGAMVLGAAVLATAFPSFLHAATTSSQPRSFFARPKSGVPQELRVDSQYFQAVSNAFPTVPAWLLQAISHVESGGHIYALNIDGRPHLSSSYEEAVRVLMKAGTKVDIGHAQINYLWTKQFGINKVDLLNPWLNTVCCGTILNWLFEQNPGQFWKAVGKYHSSTPHRTHFYAWNVYRYAKKAGIYPG